MKKKNERLKIALIVVSIILLMIVAAFVRTRMSLTALQEEHLAATTEMAENQQTVYIVSTEDGMGIGAGEVIEEGVNVVKQTVYTGLEFFNYITEEDLGSTAIIDMNEGLTVMKNMVTPVEIATDTREYEIQVCNLMVDQKENDYVDIRIMFPNGSDYLILPKKQIKNLSMEECIFWTYLNEEEILRMASATIDAFTVTGTKIYATRYVESNLQEEAVPTYVVNATVNDMMNPSSTHYDNNLLTKAITTLNMNARQELEENLSYLSEEKLTAVAEGHDIEDTAKASVLTGLGGYDYDQMTADVKADANAEAADTENQTTDSEEETTEVEEETTTSATTQ